MNDFEIERIRVPAGEGTMSVKDTVYRLSMADSRAMLVEWSADGERKRRRKRVFSGDIWVAPPGQTWWTRRESEKTCIVLSLRTEWLRRVTHASSDLLPQVQIRDLFSSHLLRTLADTADTLPASPTTDLYRESLATALVLHLAARYGQTASAEDLVVAPLPSARLRSIAAYVNEHIAEKIALTDLAPLAGLSASQFSLRFRETTGQTPHQFVTALRVGRARELLVSGRHTPADVAALTGFADQSHLTRHVRRAFGVTPGVLQKQ